MNRSHETGRTGPVGQCLSDLGDEHVQVGINDEGARPDPRMQFRLVNDSGPLIDQSSKQIEGLWGEVDIASTA